jgi:hypothetical protein
VRNYIAEAMFGILQPDWPGARASLEKKEVANRHIYLPNAHGGAGLEPQNVAIALCEDLEWNDPLRAGRLREQLDAVIRFHGIKEQQGTWDWEGGEVAAAHYGAFVAKRRGQFLRWLASHRPKKRQLDGFSISNLVENRLLAAALLGTGVQGGNRLESAIDVLVRPLEPPTLHLTQPERWRRLLQDAAEVAKEAREVLLDEVAVYQGDGKKVLAVDVAQLEPSARAFMKTWSLSQEPRAPNFSEAAVRRGAEARRDQLRQWRDVTRQWLGDDFEKQAFVDDIRAVLNQASRHDLIHRDKLEELRRLLAAFRDARITETFSAIEIALREPTDGISLASLSYHDGPISQLTTALGAQLSSVLDDIEHALEALVERSGVQEVEAVATQVRAEFDAIADALSNLERAQTP